jgi:hypothetical protein
MPKDLRGAGNQKFEQDAQLIILSTLTILTTLNQNKGLSGHSLDHLEHLEHLAKTKDLAATRKDAVRSIS